MATNQPWNANSEKECHGERWSRPEGYPTGIFVRNSLCTIGQDATNSDIVELVTMEKNHLKFYNIYKISIYIPNEIPLNFQIYFQKCISKLIYIENIIFF